MAIAWENDTMEQFEKLIAKAPIFLRDLARDKVSRKAESLALTAGHALVTEQDMIEAFFAETPFGFHGPMKSDMEDLGINYTRWGHAK